MKLDIFATRDPRYGRATPQGDYLVTSNFIIAQQPIAIGFHSVKLTAICYNNGLGLSVILPFADSDFAGFTDWCDVEARAEDLLISVRRAWC